MLAQRVEQALPLPHAVHLPALAVDGQRQAHRYCLPGPHERPPREDAERVVSVAGGPAHVVDRPRGTLDELAEPVQCRSLESARGSTTGRARRARRR